MSWATAMLSSTANPADSVASIALDIPKGSSCNYHPRNHSNIAALAIPGHLGRIEVDWKTKAYSIGTDFADTPGPVATKIGCLNPRTFGTLVEAESHSSISKSCFQVGLSCFGLPCYSLHILAAYFGCSSCSGCLG